MSQAIVLTAGVSRAAAPSHAHKTWPTRTKSAFYANFYAVAEATGATIG